MGTRNLLEQTIHGALRIVDIASSTVDSAKGILLDLLIDDGDSAQTEQGELWGIAGLQARPKAGSEADGYPKALRWRVGDTIFVLATFDPREAEDVAEGETVLHALGKDGTARALVRMKPDGTVEVEGDAIKVGGAAASQGIGLGDAVKAHLDALKIYIDAHVHSGVTTGAGSSGPPTPSPAVPALASAKHKVEP